MILIILIIILILLVIQVLINIKIIIEINPIKLYVQENYKEKIYELYITTKTKMKMKMNLISIII